MPEPPYKLIIDPPPPPRAAQMLALAGSAAAAFLVLAGQCTAAGVAAAIGFLAGAYDFYRTLGTVNVAKSAVGKEIVLRMPGETGTTGTEVREPR